MVNPEKSTANTKPSRDAVIFPGGTIIDVFRMPSVNFGTIEEVLTFSKYAFSVVAGLSLSTSDFPSFVFCTGFALGSAKLLEVCKALPPLKDF